MKGKLLTIILFLVASAAFADGPEAMHFIVEHLKLLEQQDVEGAVANLHSRGKNRAKSENDLRTKLESMNFRYKIIESTYVGQDKEFHYIRYTQHTLFNEAWQRRSGAKGIELDCLTILGREDGRLKIYDTYMFSQTRL